MSSSDHRMLTDPLGLSIGALAEAAERRFGDQCTLLFEGVETTGAEIGERARRLATGLLELGVRAGDRVSLCMANCPEVMITYQAVWRIGGVVTPLMFLLSEDELRYTLSDSEAAAIVVTPEFLPKVAAATAGLEIRIIVVGPALESTARGTAQGTVDFAELCHGAEASLTAVDPTDMAALLYTGGTTGRSKGVMLSHDALSAAAWAGTVSTVDAEMPVSILPLPLAHAFGLLVSTLGFHAVRPWRVVLMRWFDPAGWLQLAQDEKVQTGGVVPTMLRVMAAQPLEEYDLSSLRRLTSGSAPLPAEVYDQWARRVPNLEIVEGYGCSETAALAATTQIGQSRRGSVGKAAPLVELRIDEIADGDGEICVKSPSLMTGYWRDPEATALAVRDGWFHTGDVGHVDADGFLFIVDRLKDLIIRGGFNVYPRDVEEALMRHPDVANCAVIGRPDEKMGEEVVAFVQLHPGSTATADDIVAFGREHLSAVKYPREVHIVSAVPLTSIGKLDRKALRSSI